MAKTSIDALLKAIETVSYLKQAGAEQERAIAALTGRIAKLETEVAALRPDRRASESG